MNNQLTQRLEELKTEFANGQKLLAEFEVKQANLKNSLLRISGAIQVLEELLAQENVPTTKETVSNNQKQSITVE